MLEIITGDQLDAVNLLKQIFVGNTGGGSLHHELVSQDDKSIAVDVSGADNSEDRPRNFRLHIMPDGIAREAEVDFFKGPQKVKCEVEFKRDEDGLINALTVNGYNVSGWHSLGDAINNDL